MRYHEEIQRDRIICSKNFIDNLYGKANYRLNDAERNRLSKDLLVKELVADIVRHLDQHHYVYPNHPFDVDITGDLEKQWLEKWNHEKRP